MNSLHVPGLATFTIRHPLPADRMYVGGCVFKTMRQLLGTDDEDPGLNRQVDTVMSHWDGGPGESPLRLVVHVPGEPHILAAFIMADPALPRLDYLHVRPSLRGNGVARTLFRMCMGTRPVAVSSATPDLVRERATDRFPVGLLRNPNYRLHLVGAP